MRRALVAVVCSSVAVGALCAAPSALASSGSGSRQPDRASVRTATRHVGARPQAAASDPTNLSTYRKVTPTRLLDTRKRLGAAAPGRNATVHLKVAGVAPVPASGVSAVVLNVTVTAPSAGGYITAYADGGTKPTVSNLNFVKGQTVPNLVVVPVNPTTGKIALFNGSSGTTQLLADVSGYYLAGVGGAHESGAFASVAPTRLLDTRKGLGGSAPGRNGTVSLQVEGAGPVPSSGVSAVVLNVTATAPTSGGYVSAYPDGSTQPTVSSLNFVRGQTVPNLVVVPVGADGKVALFNGSSGTTQLLADVAGYYLAGSGGPREAGTFAPLTPTRLLDTRKGLGGSAPGHNGTVDLQVTGNAPVPSSDVSAVVLNVTVTAPSAGGYITAYADGGTKPTVSNLNFVKGQTVPNLVVVPVNPTTGKIALFNGSSGKTDLLADVAGYYLTGPDAASTGSISGIVTDATNHTGVGDVHVELFGPSCVQCGVDTVDSGTAKGSYTVTGLQAGNYTVCFDAAGASGASTTGYLDQCYSGQAWNGDSEGVPSGTTTVAVTASHNVAGIGAALGHAGAISGTVTAAMGGSAVAGVFVHVFGPEPDNSAVTSADGNYAITGLEPGSYTVCFAPGDVTSGSPNGYLQQCYRDQPWDGYSTPTGTTPVTVTNGATQPGIDAALTSAGGIAGTVVDGNGKPLQSVTVTADVPTENGYTQYAQATTNGDGTYTLTHLTPSGDGYDVCFYNNGQPSASQCWDHVTWDATNLVLPDDAQRVPVTSGATVAGIDATITPNP